MNKIYDSALKQSRIAGGMFGREQYSEYNFLVGWRMKEGVRLSNHAESVLDNGLCEKLGGGGGGASLKTKTSSLSGYSRGGIRCWVLVALCIYDANLRFSLRGLAGCSATLRYQLATFLSVSYSLLAILCESSGTQLSNSDRKGIVSIT